MEVKKGLGIALGPADLARLERYEKEFVPQLKEMGWHPAVELKTDRIDKDQDWVHKAVEFSLKYDGFLQWHANDGYFGQIGRGLTVEEAIEKSLSKADWLVNCGCRIVMHFGTHSWPTFDKATPEPILPALHRDRFKCPIGAGEYLELINAHVPFMKALVEHFGPGVIFGENTHLCLTGIAQYNAMQVGTAQFVGWLAEQVPGLGTVLDIEHYWELAWLLNRWGCLKFLETDYSFGSQPAINEVAEITGLLIEKDKIPVKAENFLNLEALLNRMKPGIFHIGGTMESQDEWGNLNAHLPIENLERAQNVGLNWIVDYINKYGGCMLVEANGADFWLKQNYPSSPRIRDDEEAKWVSLETTLRLIKEIS